jgi:hypothetical protein
MSSGICDRCGDASGERHLCVPPFLDRGAVTYNASTPPPSLTYAAPMSALEAERHVFYEEMRRLQAGLVVLRESYLRGRGPSPAQARAVIDALLDGPMSVDPPFPLTAENARLRALIARYADVIGDEARDVLPGVPF